MPGYVWCKCSVCSQCPASGMRQIAITAQRHTEQDEQRFQAQSSNAGLSQAVITGAGSLSDVSDIRIPTLGADAQIWVQNHSPIPEHGGMQFRTCEIWTCCPNSYSNSPPLTTMTWLTHVLSTIHDSRLPFRLNQGINHKEIEDFTTIKHQDCIGGSIWCRKMGWATEAYTGARIASESGTAL